MRSGRMKLVFAVAMAGVLGVGVIAVGAAADRDDSERLTGYEEVPAISTPGQGVFRASVNRAGNEMRYELTFGSLESAATQAHIHFENRTNSGPVIVFLCSNLGNGPAGTQPCPAGGGTVRGTIRPVDVLGSPDQGLAPGEFQEFLRAVRAGATYVNVHTTGHPSGEIRAQLEDGKDKANRGNGQG